MKIEGHLNIIEQELKSLRARLKDRVEVVRCKDCWKRNDEDFCPLVSDNCYPPILPDEWYCADGERREDGGSMSV